MGSEPIPMEAGSLWQNGHIGSCHGRLRDAFLRRAEFESVPDATAKTSWFRGRIFGRPARSTYDEHVPESSVEILGHSVDGITSRHDAHRAPLAFKAIMALPQPTAFSALLKGGDGECPCCRRRFADVS
jgi:Integrase core domain